MSLDTSSCSTSAAPRPAFRVDSANLTVRQLSDIISQELTLKLSATGPSQVGRISVFFSNVPIGTPSRVVPLGTSTTVGWAIPTTLTVAEETAYTVHVEGQYVDPVSGRVAAVYRQSVQVVATKAWNVISLIYNTKLYSCAI